MDGGAARAANFATVIKAMKIPANFEEDEDMDWYINNYQEANEASEDNKNHWARDNMPKEALDIIVPQPIYAHVDDAANFIKDTLGKIEKVLPGGLLIEEVEEELF